MKSKQIKIREGEGKNKIKGYDSIMFGNNKGMKKYWKKEKH